MNRLLWPGLLVALIAAVVILDVTMIAVASSRPVRLAAPDERVEGDRRLGVRLGPPLATGRAVDVSVPAGAGAVTLRAARDGGAPRELELVAIGADRLRADLPAPTAGAWSFEVTARVDGAEIRRTVRRVLRQDGRP